MNASSPSVTKVTPPLGSSGKPCRFDSCYPHQAASEPFSAEETGSDFLFSSDDLCALNMQTKTIGDYDNERDDI